MHASAASALKVHLKRKREASPDHFEPNNRHDNDNYCRSSWEVVHKNQLSIEEYSAKGNGMLVNKY